MDFRSSEAITKGIQKAVDRGIYGYSILLMTTEKNSMMLLFLGIGEDRILNLSVKIFSTQKVHLMLLKKQ